ncbi:hypothetical protein [Streptomyces sp. NPDC059533]|uniref:hypothetical protein n=1 Tax=unclassified Streptomyces TaxID=2593676 RepID=UPI00369C376D
MLAADPARRVRAVGDLYRLLLNQERVFPATAPAALVLAHHLGDPRTLAESGWERRAAVAACRTAELAGFVRRHPSTDTEPYMTTLPTGLSSASGAPSQVS